MRYHSSMAVDWQFPGICNISFSNEPSLKLFNVCIPDSGMKLKINCPHLVTVNKCTYELTFYLYLFKYTCMNSK